MEGDVHGPQGSGSRIQQTNLWGVHLPALAGHTVHPHQTVASVQEPANGQRNTTVNLRTPCIQAKVKGLNQPTESYIKTNPRTKKRMISMRGFIPILMKRLFPILGFQAF